MRGGGWAPAWVSRQHARGRQITAYIQSRCVAGAVAGGDAEPLSQALESFARMYETHSAYEDTIVFRAWRAGQSKAQLEDAAKRFDEIERATFKGDGFGPAATEVQAIEQALRIHDLDRYTAPAPTTPG